MTPGVQSEREAGRRSRTVELEEFVCVCEGEQWILHLCDAL